MPAAVASTIDSVPFGDDLLGQAQAGSETAFAALVREHQAMVFGLAYHVLQNWALAEELAQDVFLALHRNLTRIESAVHLVFWLRRVASNRCIDAVRSPRYRLEQPLDSHREPTASQRMRDPMLDALLRRLVAELPPHPRIVVTLRFQEDMDLSEIAEVLDMPLNTVKSHLRRSMEALRRKLEEQGHTYET